MLEIILGVIGGLALFLYSIILLSNGIQKAVGIKIRRFLEGITNRASKGIFVGAIVTSLLQSSSLVMVTLISLVNSNVLTLQQAIGVMLGAEIGTTVTAQIVAFKIGVFAFPLIAFGFLLFFVSKKKAKYLGQVIFSLGLLFLSMNIMSESIKPIKESQHVIRLLSDFGKNPILGVLAGAIFTGIIQSSSATTGLVIAMGMNNIITLPAAIALVLGANIGTCITGFIASIGTSLSARRLSISQIIFNALFVFILLPFLPFYVDIISKTASDLPRQIANAHMLFNVISAFAILPFSSLLVKISMKIIPGEEIVISSDARHLNYKIIMFPSMALLQAKKEILRLASIISGMIEDIKKVSEKFDEKTIEIINKKENAVDKLYLVIGEYLGVLSEQSLNERDSEELLSFLHMINDLERIADHIENLTEIFEEKERRKVDFSQYAKEDLDTMIKEVELMYKKSIMALKDMNTKVAREVLKEERKIDNLEETFYEKHTKRLESGVCKPMAGVIFVEALRNLERIADHSNSIAHMILDMEKQKI